MVYSEGSDTDSDIADVEDDALSFPIGGLNPRKISGISGSRSASAASRCSDRDLKAAVFGGPAFGEAGCVPGVVQQILLQRRYEEGRHTSSSDASTAAPNTPSDRRISEAGTISGYGTTISGFGHLRPVSDELTPQLHQFVQRVDDLKEIEEKRHGRQMGTLEVRSFLDLQRYNLDSIAQQKKQDPGATQLMYMFYSRIYEKLVGKQKGVDVPLFAPIDLSIDRCLSFKAVLDWATDFKVYPSRVGRRELERIFATVHPGPEPPKDRFASKITYPEFLSLVALCGSDAGEPMDRSQLDGSRIRSADSRLQQLKRFTQYLGLGNPKKVRLELHNAYRDVHFWKLSDGADFAKEARAAEMRSRPQWNVEVLHPSRALDKTRDALMLRHIQDFTWAKGEHTWEEFEAPFLDMGTSVMGGAKKSFKIVLTNRGLSVARLALEVVDGGPLRVPWKNSVLSPGQHVEVLVDFEPLECGEWSGDLLVTCKWNASLLAEEVVRVPTYMRVLPTRGAALAGGVDDPEARLPFTAPRPFKKGGGSGGNRIQIDHASISTRQLRSVTPHRNRPESAPRRPPRPVSSSTAYGNASSRGTSARITSRSSAVTAGRAPAGFGSFGGGTPSSAAARGCIEDPLAPQPPSAAPPPPTFGGTGFSFAGGDDIGALPGLVHDIGQPRLQRATSGEDTKSQRRGVWRPHSAPLAAKPSPRERPPAGPQGRTPSASRHAKERDASLCKELGPGRPASATSVTPRSRRRPPPL